MSSGQCNIDRVISEYMEYTITKTDTVDSKPAYLRLGVYTPTNSGSCLLKNTCLCWLERLRTSPECILQDKEVKIYCTTSLRVEDLHIIIARAPN